MPFAIYFKTLHSFLTKLWSQTHQYLSYPTFQRTISRALAKGSRLPGSVPTRSGYSWYLAFGSQTVLPRRHGTCEEKDVSICLCL